MRDIIITGFIGLITAVAAAYLSAKWAVRQFLQQRWWEKKEAAYSEIIEALYDLLRYSAICADIDPSIEHPKKKEFEDRYSEAYWKIQKMTDIGAFVISTEAAAILKKLRDKPELAWEDNPPWEIYEADCGYYRTALEEIRVCAKKDLKI